MQKGLKALKNLKFFTGVENYEESNSIPEDKVFNAKNARFSKKVIATKPGYEALGNLLNGGTKWQNTFAYNYFDGTNVDKKLIGIYNKTFYEFNEATQLWSAIPTVWPNIKDAYVDGINSANALYVVGQSDISTDIQATNYSFTVSGVVVTPLINDVYITNGSQYVVLGTKIIAGAGTIIMKKITSFADPLATGILGRLTGSADLFITYSAFTKPISTTYNGVGKIFSGYDFVFTVADISIVPDINSVYVINGVIFVVIATNIIAGSGTLTLKRQLNLPDPPSTGTGATISEALYLGDTTFTYTAYTKSAQVNTAFTVIPNSPDGIAIESFANRLVITGHSGAVGMIIMSAPILQPGQDWKLENFQYLITGSGSLTFFTLKGGVHKACRVINNLIFYWTDDFLFQQAATDVTNGTNPTELARTTGALNQKSTIVVENDVWFFNKQNEVRSLGDERNLGGDPRTKSISEIIKRTMQLLEPTQDNPVMSYNQRILKISLKTRQSPTNNLNLIFDYNTGGFGIDLGQAINCACIWKGIRIYGEDATGQVFKDDIGYGANGGAYPFQVDLPFYDESRPDLFRRARYIYVRGKQSYYQPLTIRLYRGNYNIFSDYIIPSPFDRGITLMTPSSDGIWGGAVIGGAPRGGSSTDPNNGDIQLYEFEELISVERRSNMFAIGLIASVNNGKIEVEQVILKVVDENENYKRSDL